MRERFPTVHDPCGSHSFHLIQHGLEWSGLRQGERVDDQSLIAAQRLYLPASVLHDLGRERAALGHDRQPREGSHPRVAAHKDLLEEMIHREARSRVFLLRTGRLGKPRPPEPVAAGRSV
ncbi:MAG: hypothetical protein LC739_12100 [Actinobacteria bacterium]|nr:hypothetical protein [Actinomycetota bacterium]